LVLKGTICACELDLTGWEQVGSVILWSRQLSGVHKSRRIYWPSKLLSVFTNGICYMKLQHQIQFSTVQSVCTALSHSLSFLKLLQKTSFIILASQNEAYCAINRAEKLNELWHSVQQSSVNANGSKFIQYIYIYIYIYIYQQQSYILALKWSHNVV
jgi:hypothetical protein